MTRSLTNMDLISTQTMPSSSTISNERTMDSSDLNIMISTRSRQTDKSCFYKCSSIDSMTLKEEKSVNCFKSESENK